MEHNFWLDKWKSNELGFHQENYNENFQKHFHLLELKKGDTLFFPLCGKTKDMIWAAEQEINVIGCELSEIACRDFFEENNLIYEKIGSMFVGKNINLHHGDIFELTPSQLKNINAVYDRAALIALPKELRKKYALFFQENFIGIKILLDVIELYKENDVIREEGPPHSVTEEEILNIYSPQFEVKKLKSENIDVIERFLQNGIKKINNSIYLLK